MGDFQRRLNRDQDQGWSGRRDYSRGRDINRGNDRGKGWDSTPRSERGGYRDAASVRVPNVGWDSTPRNGRAEDGTGWGGARNRTWDAPTPRAVRGGSPDDGDGALGIDAREWEEEQVRLDRDWYTGAEECGVAGDEEHNPLAQYQDLSSLKEAEVANRQVVSVIRRPCMVTHGLTFHFGATEEDLGEAGSICMCFKMIRPDASLCYHTERRQRPLGSESNVDIWGCHSQSCGSRL